MMMMIMMMMMMMMMLIVMMPLQVPTEPHYLFCVDACACRM
jgi:hypothetical protein